MQNSEKGFTLIELLIVIGIVAILAVVVVLTINPAELLRQARDSNRISDMGTLRAAISLYLSDVTSPSLGTSGTCYMSTATTSANCGFTGTYTANATTSRGVSGNNGWLPVNFTSISSGAPLGNLPIDPVNSGAYYYSYAHASNLTFELNANMESTRYAAGGGSDQETNDGGNNVNLFESGTDSGLDL